LIEKIVHGNFSFSLMFMNIDAQIKKREILVRENKQLERDIINWGEIKTYITIYLTEIAIPDYIRRANTFYASTLSKFVREECQNCESKLACWQELNQIVNAQNSMPN
jgi:hypothetical protein